MNKEIMDIIEKAEENIRESILALNESYEEIQDLKILLTIKKQPQNEADKSRRSK